MDSEKYWNSFETSGRIEDYLRYKGIQNIDGITKNGGLNEATESERNSNQGNTI